MKSTLCTTSRHFFPRYSLVASLLTTISFSWSPVAIRHTTAPIFSNHHRERSFFLTNTQRNMATAATANTDNCPLESLGLPSPLILGSASFTRKLILKEMGVPYHIIIRPIDEKNLGDRSKDHPADLVFTLGKAKADHLVNEIKEGRCDDDLADGKPLGKAGCIVLTGDQVVTCAGKILEKPESIDEAKYFVSHYPETPPSTVGSCVLTHVPSGVQVSGVDTATVHFRNDFSGEQLVDELLQEDAPIMSCAGGLMVEHPKVKQNIDRIDGTEDSVMGLSKDLVLRLLKEMAEKLKEANALL